MVLLDMFDNCGIAYMNILLKEKLPDSLSDEQKVVKIRYLLQRMKQEGIIATEPDNLSCL